MAYNLGNAYINVIPRMDGAGRKIEKELAGVGERAGSAKGKGLGGKLFGGLKVAAAGAGVAVGGVLAGSITKGFNRLRDIENAEAKLTGLGHSAETVEGVMANALASVKGTAFGLGDAAGLAGTLVASGIKPGKDLEKTLKLTADSATIAGRELGDMGLIWGSVAAKGKLQGDDAMQLLASGVPIWQMVGDVMGKTAGEAQELGSKGEVSFEIFQKAMEQGVGGAAQKAGNTTEGAFKNMGAAMGRFGAALLKDVYPLVGPVLNKVTELFDYLTDAAGPILETVSGKIAEFGKGLKGVWDILVNGEFTGAENLFGFEEDSGLVDFLFNVHDGVKGVYDILFKGDFTGGFREAFNLEEDSPFVDFLFDIREGAIQLYERGLKPLAQFVSDNIIPIFAGLGAGALYAGITAVVGAIGGAIAAAGGLSGVIGSVVGAIAWVPLAVGAAVAAVIWFFRETEAGQAIFEKIVSFVRDTLVPGIVTAFTAVKNFIVEELWPIIKSRFEAIRDLAVQVWQGVIQPAFEQFVGFLQSTVFPIIQRLWQEYIQPAFMAIGGLAVWLWENAFKPAMSGIDTFIRNVLGPAIVWLWQNVVSPIFGLIGKFIGWVWNTLIFPYLDAMKYYFTVVLPAVFKFLWEVAKQVWSGISAAISAVVNWITGTAVPFIQAAWDLIAAGAIWLYQNAILPAWNGIKTAIQVVGDWITGTLWPALQTAWSAIGAAAMWLWRNVIEPVWNGIKVAIAVAVTAIMVYIDLMKWYFKNVIAPVALWLYNSIIKPVWDGIKTAIGVVVNWIANTAWPIIKTAWNAIAAAARWLYGSVILPVWNAIKAAISVVVSWLMNTAWPLVKRTIDLIGSVMRWLYNNVVLPVWNAIKTAIGVVVNAVKAYIDGWIWLFKNVLAPVFKWLYNTIVKPVWDAIKLAIKLVVDWFRDSGWPGIKRVIELLKTGFNTMRDSIKNAWNFVKDKVISPVANWFRDKVQPLFKKSTDGVADSFDTLKKAVKKSWDAIRDTAKAPIKFVVQDIIRDGIVKKYNSVAGTFGVDTIDESKFTVGWSSGGYTGPGSKYTPAGVVHADEYVIRKESQNDLRRNAPGFLDSLNRHGARALGYAKGGLVKLRPPFAGSYPRGDGFGARGGRHQGVDYPMPHGAVLKAVGAGHVRHTRNANAGNKLELVLGNGLVAGYHHLSSYIAKAGSSVGRGADVARVGSTGRSSGPHLHFSLKRDGKYVDPMPYLGGGGSAGEGGGGGMLNPFAGLWDSLKSKVRKGVGDSPLGDMLFEVPQKLIGGAVGWASKKISELGDWGMEQIDGAVQGVKSTRWLPVATQALQMEGEFSQSNLSSLMRRMNQESGFNPQAINKTDSNWRKGTPSKGLMQVIDPTFRSYARPGYGKNIWDPLSNILASIRYARARYGSPARGWNQPGGYADGGWTGPGSKYTPAGTVHADEFVVRKSSRRSIESARPGFLDALNRHGASALAGYAKGGLVGYASGGRVSPTSKIGSTKVTVLLDGLTGSFKQVQSAAGKLADGIVKTFNDRMKSAKTATVNKLSDSLAGLKSQASSLKKTISATTAKSKKSAINKLSDDLAALRKQKKTLSETAKEVRKVTKVTGTTKSGKKITKTVTVATDAAKKAAKSLKSVNRSIDATQTALTKARRGDYSSTAKSAQKQLAAVNKQIEATDKALKAARRGDYSSAAMVKGTKAYNKYVADGVKRLEAYANKSDALTAKLKNANSALTEARKVRSDYITSLDESFAGTYGLSAESATTGIETIIRGFKNGASTVATFAGQFKQLQSRGLGKGLLDQIAQLGATDGSKVAKNLLSATDAQIKEITKQYNSLNRKSSSASTSIGDDMYKTGVQAAEGLVKGLTAQLDKVTKASENLANQIVKTVRKKLDIHSPSRVFKQIGVFTGAGMVEGIEQVTPDVQSAMSRLATPPEAYSGGGLGSGAAGRGGAGALIENATVYGLSAEDVAREFDKLVRRRESLYA